MYAWKCWRDTRARYLTLLITCVLLGVALAGSFMFTYDLRTKGFSYNPPRVPTEVDYASRMVCDRFSLIASLLAVVLGLTLGGGGLGEELQDGTATYLLTRPRRRDYFMQVRWGVAIAQIAAFSFAIAVAPFAILYFCTGRVGNSSFFRMGLMCFTFSLLSFALADLCTLLRENVRDGIAIAAGVGIGWLVGNPAINDFWDLRLPSPVSLLIALKPPVLVPGSLHDLQYGTPFGRVVVGSEAGVLAYWLLSAAGWIVAALALMIPAGYFFSRKEV